MKKKNKIIIGAIAAATLLFVWCMYIMFFSCPIKVERSVFLYVDADDNVDSVCVKLKNDLHVSSVAGFRVLAIFGRYASDVHPGAYRFDKSDNNLRIFRRLRTGNQTPVRLTVPSVRTMGNLVKTLSRKLMADSVSLASVLMDSVSVSAYGYNHNTILALFVPDTYEVYWTVSPQELLERMVKEHNRFWNNERIDKAKEIGFTPIEVCTIASIVEEETANKAEKPDVAGLYINRLHADMLLQADPTVKFALQDFGLRRILHKHLECDSPYNTYKRKGLPPGPIRIPSIDGIDAVLNYTHHDWLYMCAKEDFSGTHNFAKTWSEHLNNARKYQKALDERNIR